MTATSRRGVLAANIVAILCGALLLFLVQPIVARTLLPALGGSPSVWATCMVFFQLLLLAGYAYAHLLTTRLGNRAQRVVHLAVWAAGWFFLSFEWGEPAAGAAPVGWMLGTLVKGIGMPFFALSATGPLVQRWFSQSRHRKAHDPYFLYAASNAGSLVALLGYPLLFEPALGLTSQREVWSWVYLAYGACVAAAGWVSLAPKSTGASSAPADPAPAARRRLTWVALAAVPSSLFLGVTQHVTTQVVTFPLLWVVPLAIYLATLIVAYTRHGEAARRWGDRALPPLVLIVVFLIAYESPRFIVAQVLAHFLALAAVGLSLHGRLAALRPGVGRLTEYYLWTSFGGALGGVFNALLAPVVFTAVLEYPCALALACFLRMVAEPKRKWPVDLALAAALFGVFLATRQFTDDRAWRFGLPCIAALMYWPRARRLALGVLVLLCMPSFELRTHYEVVHQERTFFGVHRVLRQDTQLGPIHWLFHGLTVHGQQFREPKYRRRPTAYFDAAGPAGDIAAWLRMRDRKPRIVIVGLGAG
ncbi:MAG: hypothetical protein OER88_10370, partial [Planctomycetota bacterium]|nr:hypothetical protein [Planctomycetota bacterium]